METLNMHLNQTDILPEINKQKIIETITFTPTQEIIH